MKIKALLTALFLAGVMASLALGATSHQREGTSSTTTSTVTTTGEKAKCHAVGLAGLVSTGSVAFTATKASKNAASLAGTQVTLTIPAGARVHAIACADANGALTLRSLRIVPAHGDKHGHAHGDDKQK